MSETISRPRSRLIHGLWLGPLVTFVGMVSYFQVFVRFPTLRDFPWVNLPLVLLGLGLTLGGMWVAFSRPTRLWVRLVGTLGFLFATVVGGFFMTYVFAISYQLPGVSPTTVNLERAPELELVDSAGKAHRLSDYLGKRVVLVFYRGHW